MDVYAHRGSSVQWPENTLAAFQAAVDDGADAIETDVRLTRDGKLVLLHDEDLRRMAGDPRRVADVSAQELQEVRVGHDHRVPHLEELQEIAGGRVRLNLEIKARGVGLALARALASARDGDRVLVTSAHPLELTDFRTRRPRIPVGPVLECLGPQERDAALAEAWSAISLRADGFREEALSFCRERNLRLLLWVVNAPERVIDFHRLGIDGIFCDCPGSAVAALRRLPLRRGDLVR